MGKPPPLKVFETPRLAPGGLAAFVQGAKLPLRAMGFLIERPRHWPLVAIPVAVNMAVFLVFLYWGFTSVPGFVEGFLSDTSASLAQHEGFWWAILEYLIVGLRWLAALFLWCVVLVVVYYVFTPVALLIASPFNDRLADNTERACGFGIQDDRPLVKMVVAEAAFTVFSEAKRLAFMISVFLLLLPINLLPGIGSLLYTAAAFYWACWCAAMEFTGYAADRRHLGMRRKFRLIQANKPSCLGFGLATAVLMMIPFLNVLMVPVSAVGGTLLFGMIRQKDLASLETS